MEVFEIGIDQLIPSQRILRKNDGAVGRMMAAIKEYGMPIPILGRHRGEKIEIVDGHLRVKASRKMGLLTVPVVFCDDWSEAQVKAFRILVNRSATWATWDEGLVALELVDLDALDFDLGLTGFDPFEINEFLFPDAVESSAEKVPELPKTAVTRLGDLWLCDSHRILAGDATSAEAVAKLNGKESPKLLLTDPPYGVNYDPTWRERAGLGRAQQTGLVKNDDRADWTEAYKLFTGDVAYVWNAGVQAAEVAAGLEAAGFRIRAQIIWVKQHFALSRGDFHWQHENCWYAVREGKSSKVNTELRTGRRIGAGTTRVPQNALLAGLLLCKSCQRPMIPTYTAKPGRRYRYYVCRAARQNGWSSCPTKSVPASMIEDAVLDQLRTALRDSGTREKLNVPEAQWQSFEQDRSALVRAVVKEVSYDGTTGAVSLNLTRSEDTRED